MGAQILVLIIALIIKGAVSANKGSSSKKKYSNHSSNSIYGTSNYKRTSISRSRNRFGEETSRHNTSPQFVKDSVIESADNTKSKQALYNYGEEYKQDQVQNESNVEAVVVTPTITETKEQEYLEAKKVLEDAEKAKELHVEKVELDNDLYSNYGEVAFDLPNVDTSFSTKVDFDLPSLGGEMDKDKDEVVDSIVNGRIDSTATPSQKLKFTITTLIYVMYEDDGNFSKKEKKLVKIMLKQSKGTLPESDLDSIEALLETRPNLDTVVTTMESSGLSTYDALDIIKTLRKTLRKQEAYDRVLSRIENRISLEY